MERVGETGAAFLKSKTAIPLSRWYFSWVGGVLRVPSGAAAWYLKTRGPDRARLDWT